MSTNKERNQNRERFTYITPNNDNRKKKETQKVKRDKITTNKNKSEQKTHLVWQCKPEPRAVTTRSKAVLHSCTQTAEYQWTTRLLAYRTSCDR
jgi:hypothetical protein